MTYEELVSFIRGEGCRVYVYKNKETICGGNRGTFDGYCKKGPIICVAVKDLDLPRAVETLLHEYGHFLQWQDGFIQYLDNICDAYDIEEKWIRGRIELEDRELITVRNTMLTMEYDAEKRAFKNGCWLEPDNFEKEFYLRGANAYMDAIKWSFDRRIPTADVPERGEYSAKIMTNDELYEDLEEETLIKLDAVLNPRLGPFRL